MTPRIRSLAPEAPMVFREFVRQLERLHAPPAKKAEKPKRSPRAKTKPKTKRKR